MTNRKTMVCSIALLAAFVSAWAISADDAAKPPASFKGEPTNVALLDVNKIFKENAAFNREMEKMKETEAVEKQIKDARKDYDEMMAKLAVTARGSDEYVELQRKIVSSQTMFNTEYQLQRQDFIKREALIHQIVYQAIESEVQNFCQEHNIDMVLRFQGDPVDENKPDSILANINKSIVSYNAKLDITSPIQEIMSGKEIQFPAEKK